METFTAAKGFVAHPSFGQDRQHALSEVKLNRIDPPLVDLIRIIAALPHCFSLQSCYGHFMWSAEQDRRNLDRLPYSHAGRIVYRIAYLAVCLQSSSDGQAMRSLMERIAGLDPDFVQFGSADWFWNQYPNTFVLQVEPERFKCEDRIEIGHAEALRIEAARDLFFVRLAKMLKPCTDGTA